MIGRIIEFSAANKALVFLLIGFAVAVGIWSMYNVPLDALPDLSDTQVIVYSRWDRSPDIMEDQVTYPIVTSMLGAPNVKAVRGFSDFGYSYVYIVFEDGTDIYWARSRTLEYLSGVLQRLPQGVTTELGPDATGVGWVFQYALVDTSGTQSLAELRSLQDWFLNYQLKAVPGVAEVAPIGGFVRQYQVNVDPNRLAAYSIPMTKVVEAVRGGNNDVGGRMVELSGTEYMVRGRGYARSIDDIGKIVLATSAGGVPVRVQDVGQVVLGPDIRRGIADWNGEGDVVSGIVVMRQGGNAMQVIERVKEKLHELEPGLPKGVKIVSAYDRSELIQRSIDNLKHTLTEEMIIVAIIIFIFLWHFPSAMIPVFTIPIAIILSFIPMKMMGLTSNIMSLGGIAIAIGAMVDASIVVVEQTHKKLEIWERTRQEGRLSSRGHRRRERSRRAKFLRAPGDRGGVSSGSDAGSAGRPPVQAARLHEELLHDHRGRARHHPRSGDAPRVHAHEELRFQAALDRQGDQRRTGRDNSFRRKPSHQPRPDAALRTCLHLGASLEMVRDCGRGRSERWSPFRSSSSSDLSSCRRSTKARCSTCRRPYLASPLPTRSA